MRTSLILTVKNESESLPQLLDSIAAQTRQPDEIVVVDGGSTDGTLDVLRARAPRLPLKILNCPGANISAGRNAAIRAATGEVICSTDAGVRLDACWLEELMRPFADGGVDQFPGNRSSPAVDVVAGFFVPDPMGVFETALAATTLPALQDVRPARFLPSSRSVAFRKSAWESVGGYPEWLDYCEDLIFDLALRARGYGFAFAPRAVAHFRPRPTLRAFFNQYYLYARGDGKANLWLKRHVIRYLTYFVALPLLIALTIAAPVVSLLFWLAAGTFMFFTPYRRLFLMLRGLSFVDKLRASAWVPVLRVTGDVAKMIGYPFGVAWRLRFAKPGPAGVQAGDRHD
ncbi:MAG: glycosyltransferase [Chloroflexi bacterium]|nr:glycosyltransferase [Chloroflexota bacterium]